MASIFTVFFWLGYSIRAQSTDFFSSGQSLIIEGNEVIYILNMAQSGSTLPKFKVEINSTTNEFSLNPYTTSGPYGLGPVALAGPARLAFDSDSVLTYQVAKSTQFKSFLYSNSEPGIINLGSGFSLLLFTPIRMFDSSYSAYNNVEIEAPGGRIFNATLTPPVKLIGPLKIKLRAPEASIATIMTQPLNSGEISVLSDGAGVFLQESNDLISWRTIVATNPVSSQVNFFRVTTGN